MKHFGNLCLLRVGACVGLLVLPMVIGCAEPVWYLDHGFGERLAKQKNKPLLFYFKAWDSTGHRNMRLKVFNDPAVKAELLKTVNIELHLLQARRAVGLTVLDSSPEAARPWRPDHLRSDRHGSGSAPAHDRAPYARAFGLSTLSGGGQAEVGEDLVESELKKKRRGKKDSPQRHRESRERK